MLIFKREIENQITKNIEKEGITLIFVQFLVHARKTITVL